MSTYTLYGIPNCNTVKNAMLWLKEHQIEYIFHNFKKDGISVSLLEKWMEAFGWETVINKKGLTFKKLDKEAQAEIHSQQAAIAYLLENTSAIKRPILEIDNLPTTIGFDAATYASKIG